MSHPDEGTIQMLLDGELDPGERARIEGHMATCASCAARLAEASAFLQEANRLVEVLAVPDQGARPRVSVLRRPLVRTLAWAASIVIAVGIGYWGRGANPATPIAAVLQEGGTAARDNAASGAPAAVNEPAPLSAAKTAPIQPATEAPARSDADIDRRSAEATPADQPNANELERKAVATPPLSAAARERSAQAARPEALAAPGARLADEATSTWRVISMEEAVEVLGGQIRLIDGMVPDRLEAGPGTAVAGADPSLPLVRVVYAAGAVMLDEQRPGIAPDARPAARRREGRRRSLRGIVSDGVAEPRRDPVCGDGNSVNRLASGAGRPGAVNQGVACRSASTLMRISTSSPSIVPPPSRIRL